MSEGGLAKDAGLGTDIRVQILTACFSEGSLQLFLGKQEVCAEPDTIRRLDEC